MTEVFAHSTTWAPADVVALPGTWVEVGPVLLSEDVAARREDEWILPRFDELGHQVATTTQAIVTDAAEEQREQKVPSNLALEAGSAEQAGPNRDAGTVATSDASSAPAAATTTSATTDNATAGGNPGYQAGYDEGFAAGQAAAAEAAASAEAEERGRRAAATKKHLTKLASNISALTQQIDGALGASLTEAVATITAATVGYEWLRSPAAITSLVDSVLRQAGSEVRDAVILLNPADLEQLAPDQFDGADAGRFADVQFTADAQVRSGQVQLRHAFGSSSEDVRDRLRTALELTLGASAEAQLVAAQFDQSLETGAELMRAADAEMQVEAAPAAAGPETLAVQDSTSANSDLVAPEAALVPPTTTDSNADLH